MTIRDVLPQSTISFRPDPHDDDAIVVPDCQPFAESGTLPAVSPRVQLAWLSLAMFLGMTLWFSATAANAPIIGEFQLTSAQIAWLTMAVQGGFVIGTLVSALLNLPDVLSPRRLFNVGCIAGAVANALLAVADSPSTIIMLRLLTGAASATIPWRVLILVASARGIVVTLVGDGPYVAAGGARFDPAAGLRVFSDRQTRLATLGYLGHMWELYAVWTWIASFAAASLTAAGSGSLIAFVTIASGAVGSAAAGVFADRIGKARVAAWAMIASGGCCAAAGFMFRAPAPLLFAFAALWGVAVVADSAQLSALVAQYSPRDHVGTALTIQTCVGFLLTMVSIRLLPIVAGMIGWQWAFVALVPGPLSGAIALRGLMRP
jgi:MFS family permease